MRKPRQEGDLFPQRHDAFMHGRCHVVPAFSDREPAVVHPVRSVVVGHRDSVGEVPCEESLLRSGLLVGGHALQPGQREANAGRLQGGSSIKVPGF